MFTLLAAGMVEFQAGPPQFTKEIDPRPTAARMVRILAHAGDVVTNLRHEPVALEVLTVACFRSSTARATRRSSWPGWRRSPANGNSGKVGRRHPVTDPAERARILSQTLQLFLRRLADHALLEARSPRIVGYTCRSSAGVPIK